LPEAAAGETVGRSGEYTAAVLSTHRDRRVSCPLPGAATIRELPLAQAVNLWLRDLALVSSIASEERGKLGFEMRLQVQGVRRPLDPTTVGVGISQALPVVVLGLISPPGSLVVFEQPELHLHPDVQAGLADFFLALADTGRQILVETHSEYLVNRLRRRAAERSPHDVPNLVRLFYVERTGAASTVRPVFINGSGAIPDWPAGFFDQSAREVEAIVRSAIGSE
jgi:predicted ATPase